jgi:hypothetical protein
VVVTSTRSYAVSSSGPAAARSVTAVTVTSLGAYGQKYVLRAFSSAAALIFDTRFHARKRCHVA